MSHLAPLPFGFEDLAPFVEKWARPTETGRNAIRWSASAEEFADFYATFMPRLASALERLDGVALDAMNEGEKTLFLLTAAFAEAAPHHELYGGSAEVPFSFAARRFVPAHGDTPSSAKAMR
ncbi:MAG: hypothetical protein ACOY5R_12720 [Pseudomonadota bacterium]